MISSTHPPLLIIDITYYSTPKRNRNLGCQSKIGISAKWNRNLGCGNVFSFFWLDANIRIRKEVPVAEIVQKSIQLDDDDGGVVFWGGYIVVIVATAAVVLLLLTLPIFIFQSNISNSIHNDNVFGNPHTVLTIFIVSL